jgi:hypothetical protein
MQGLLDYDHQNSPEISRADSISVTNLKRFIILKAINLNIEKSIPLRVT